VRGYLITSLVIGAVDYGGLILLSARFPFSVTLAWILTAIVLWIATVGIGMYRFGRRFLWALMGLPLVLMPLAAFIVAAGSI
jgi:hypothetical protein